VLFLTNYRLFFIQDKNASGATAFGLAGALVQSAVTAGQSGAMSFCLPLNDIGTLSDDKAGLMKAMLLTSKSHGSVGKLVIAKRDEWRAIIGQAVQQYAGA
jgi:hypothetical protein